MATNAMDWVVKQIDESVAVNGPRLRDETFDYIQHHEADVVNQLRSHQYAAIPTSFGMIKLTLSDLEAAL